MEFSNDSPRILLGLNNRDADYLGKDPCRSLGLAVKREQIYLGAGKTYV